MSEYLLPPYKAYIKTTTGKYVKTSQIVNSEIIRGDLYVIWQERYYGTIVVFKERVIATADTMEELANGENDIPKKRPIRY